MSGIKHNEARIREAQRRAIEAENQRRAAEERRRREEAERKERERQLKIARNTLAARLEACEQSLAASPSMLSDDRAKLERELAALQSAHPQDIAGANKAIRQSDQLLEAVPRAVERFRKEEERRLDRLEKASAGQTRLQELIGKTDRAIRQKFDSGGAAEAQRKIEELARTCASGNADKAESALTQAEQSVRRHLDTVLSKHSEWRERKQRAEAAVAEAEALLEGLKADQVTSRWTSPRYADVQTAIDASKRSVSNEDFDEPVAMLSRVQEYARSWERTAQTAQLEADKRDYIVQSLQQSLESMGFVTALEDETPAHPATSKLIRSASPSGRRIYASIPFSGEVQYNVDGYPIRDESTSSGDPSTSCDEAMQELLKLHDIVAQFGVEMGEINWDGKDPDRILRKADELPRSGQERGRTS
ncbi:MAG: hypothetical protein K8H99_13300 [Nitrospirae bacterium]|nr:hypothetical protein [Fimbriimonadaceae bacterium]